MPRLNIAATGLIALAVIFAFRGLSASIPSPEQTLNVALTILILVGTLLFSACGVYATALVTGQGCRLQEFLIGLTGVKWTPYRRCMCHDQHHDVCKWASHQALFAAEGEETRDFRGA